MVGLVSMASGDLHPVLKVVLKWSRELGRLGYNKQGMGEHMQIKSASTHREHFECIPPNVVPISPLPVIFAAKTSREGHLINDSSEALVLRKIWWVWHQTE